MLALVLLSSLVATLPGALDVRDVAGVLERSAQARLDENRLAAELVALGPVRIPDLFAVLASGSALDHPLQEPEENALVRALASLGIGPLRSFLRPRLSAGASAEEGEAALRVLTRIGSSEDVPLLRQAVPVAGAGLARTLKEACTAILRRDARALEALRRWMLEAPFDIGAAIAGAVGESSCPGALAALASTLGFRADLDAELLERIAPLAARAPKPLDEDVVGPIEDVLEEGDVPVLRPAAMALGYAQHAGAVPRLIELLGHENRGVSTGAEWALTQITGLRLHDAERWTAWLRAERAWLEREGPRLHAQLRVPRAEVVIRALGELSSHRWRRDELALDALAGLKHESPLVRRLTCTVLARLGSSAAEAGLVRALEDEDETVALAARAALDALGLAPGEPAAGERAAILGEPSRRSLPRPRNRQQSA
jgi:hypothetical protein